MFGIDDMALAVGGSALLNAGSGIFGGMLGASGQASANQLAWEMASQRDQFNAHQADIARQDAWAFSGSAYQRAANDLQQAGLNRILALGSPATSAGSGAQGSAAGAIGVGNPGAAMQAGLTAAGQAFGHSAQVKAMLTQADKDSSQVDLNKATEKNADAQTDLNKAATDRTKQDERTSAATEVNQRAQATAANAQAAVNAANVGLVLEQTNSARARAKIDQLDYEDQKAWGVPRNESWASAGRRIGRTVVQNMTGGAQEVPTILNSLPSTAQGWWQGWDQPVKPNTPGGRFRSWIEGK